jgi:hypothetical protein
MNNAMLRRMMRMATLTSGHAIHTDGPGAAAPKAEVSTNRMRTRLFTLLLALFSFPSLSHGEETCLWLNAATAGGVLGGPVTLSVSQADPHPADVQPANAKSASGPMSADATGNSYAGNIVDDSDCIFDRQPLTAGKLQIKVRTMGEPQKMFATYAAQCGAHAVPLKAIGNEATACRLKGKDGRPYEQVVGRIRDRIFVLELSIGDPSMTPAMLQEKARSTAEIVAGNLF